MLFKLIIVDPMLKHGVLPLVISTIALSLFLKESAKDFYSSQAQPFPALVPATDIHYLRCGDLDPEPRRAGRRILTVAALQHPAQQDPARPRRCRRPRRIRRSRASSASRCSGWCSTRFCSTPCWCAIASILISPIYLAKFTNGETLGIAAFIAAIIGGFNQVRGAILGGFILGVLDNLSAAYISSQYRGAFPLIILIAVILLRPQGLLGRLEERTV